MTPNDYYYKKIILDEYAKNRANPIGISSNDLNRRSYMTTPYQYIQKFHDAGIIPDTAVYFNETFVKNTFRIPYNNYIDIFKLCCLIKERSSYLFPGELPISLHEEIKNKNYNLHYKLSKKVRDSIYSGSKEIDNLINLWPSSLLSYLYNISTINTNGFIESFYKPKAKLRYVKNIILDDKTNSLADALNMRYASDIKEIDDDNYIEIQHRINQKFPNYMSRILNAKLTNDQKSNNS